MKQIGFSTAFEWCDPDHGCEVREGSRIGMFVLIDFFTIDCVRVNDISRLCSARWGDATFETDPHTLLLKTEPAIGGLSERPETSLSGFRT